MNFNRTHLVAVIVIIFAASFVIEYYTNQQFPELDVKVTTLPDFTTGVRHTFSFVRQGSNVGTYSYYLEKTVTGYSVMSETQVEFEEKSTFLQSNYTFGATMNPLDYSLFIDSGDEPTEIVCTFTDNQVVTTVNFENKTVDIDAELPENTVLVENNMPGYWELLLQTVDLQPGNRYMIQVFVPQVANVVPVTLTVDKNPVNLNIDGVVYECQRIREVDVQYAFFLYEGQLLEFRDDGQDIRFQKIIE